MHYNPTREGNSFADPDRGRVMRKLIRYLALAAAGLVLAVVALLVVLRVMFPPSSLRPLVESRLSAATNRKVSVESVGFSIPTTTG